MHDNLMVVVVVYYIVVAVYTAGVSDKKNVTIVTISFWFLHNFISKNEEV